MARSLIATITAIAVAAAALFLSSHYNNNHLPTWLLSLNPSSPAPISALTKSLHPLLSPSAQILLPGNPAFKVATDRWQNYAPPTFAAVVQVATEGDVQATIRWANSVGVPFLAVAGGHGSTAALGRFKKGVGIWLRELRDIEILDGHGGDGDRDGYGRARIGGGVLSGEVVWELWDKGKMAGESWWRRAMLVGQLTDWSL